jgi:hypothetical protein
LLKKIKKYKKLLRFKDEELNSISQYAMGESLVNDINGIFNPGKAPRAASCSSMGQRFTPYNTYISQSQMRYDVGDRASPLNMNPQHHNDGIYRQNMQNLSYASNPNQVEIHTPQKVLKFSEQKLGLDKIEDASEMTSQENALQSLRVDRTGSFDESHQGESL